MRLRTPGFGDLDDCKEHLMFIVSAMGIHRKFVILKANYRIHVAKSGLMGRVKIDDQLESYCRISSKR